MIVVVKVTINVEGCVGECREDDRDEGEDEVLEAQHLAQDPVHLVGPHQPVKEHGDVLGGGGEGGSEVDDGEDDGGSIVDQDHEASYLVVQLRPHDVFPVLEQAGQAKEHQERVPVPKLPKKHVL